MTGLDWRFILHWGGTNVMWKDLRDTNLELCKVLGGFRFLRVWSPVDLRSLVYCHASSPPTAHPPFTSSTRASLACPIECIQHVSLPLSLPGYICQVAVLGTYSIQMSAPSFLYTCRPPLTSPCTCTSVCVSLFSSTPCICTSVPPF